MVLVPAAPPQAERRVLAISNTSRNTDFFMVLSFTQWIVFYPPNYRGTFTHSLRKLLRIFTNQVDTSLE
jgi:hypothetical protein